MKKTIACAFSILAMTLGSAFADEVTLRFNPDPGTNKPAQSIQQTVETTDTSTTPNKPTSVLDGQTTTVNQPVSPDCGCSPATFVGTCQNYAWVRCCWRWRLVLVDNCTVDNNSTSIVDNNKTNVDPNKQFNNPTDPTLAFCKDRAPASHYVWVCRRCRCHCWRWCLVLVDNNQNGTVNNNTVKVNINRNQYFTRPNDGNAPMAPPTYFRRGRNR